jgi:hypothetical protein
LPATWEEVSKPANIEFQETRDCQNNRGFFVYTKQPLNNEKKTNMNNRINETIRTRFGPEVRFDVPTAPFRATETTALEELKKQLLRQWLEQATETGQNILLRRAANDAAALAWLTQYPLLVFPTLLDEKVRAAFLQHKRQAGVRRRSQKLLLQAA